MTFKNNWYLIGGGVLLTVIIILIIYLAMQKRAVTSGNVKEGYQNMPGIPAHFRFISKIPGLNNQYLKMNDPTNDNTPAIVGDYSEPNTNTGNQGNTGRYFIVDKVDYYDNSALQVPTMYFRMQPYLAPGTKFYMAVYDFATGKVTFKLVDYSNGLTKDTLITVFSIKVINDTNRIFSAHIVKYSEFQDVANNLSAFYKTKATHSISSYTTDKPPTWFYLYISASSDGKSFVLNVKPADEVSVETLTASYKLSSILLLPSMPNLSDYLMVSNGNFFKSFTLTRDNRYPNNVYRITNQNVSGANTLTYTNVSGPKLDFQTSISDTTRDKAQLFGVTSAVYIGKNITNPSLLFITPLIDIDNVRYEQTTLINSITIGESGFLIRAIESADIATNSDLLTNNCVLARGIFQYGVSTIAEQTNNTKYFIQNPLAIKNGTDIVLTTTSSSISPKTQFISNGRPNEVHLYNGEYLLTVSPNGNLGWVSKLSDASSLMFSVVSDTDIIKRYYITDVKTGLSLTVGSALSNPYLYFTNVTDNSKKSIFRIQTATSETSNNANVNPFSVLSELIRTPLPYLNLSATPATTPAATSPVTTPAATSPASTPAATSPASTPAATTPSATSPVTTTATLTGGNMSTEDMAKFAELEKSQEQLTDQIAELTKSQQLLTTALSRLDGDYPKLSDEESRANNNSARLKVKTQLDGVIAMLDKLKSLTDNKPRSDYVQRGGSVRKTDSGVTVSDYEGVLNIFYPQFL